MPFMENKNVHDLVRQDLHWRALLNKPALTTPLPFLRCPSGRPTEPTGINMRDTGVIEENALRSHYVAIAGARPGPAEPRYASRTDIYPSTSSCAAAGGGRGSSSATFTYPESTYFQYACENPDGSTGATASSASSGGVATNGSVIPLGDFSSTGISDGTSNTMMFGEISWLLDPQEPWLVGSTSNNNLNGVFEPISSSFGVVWNMKNVRYQINQYRRIQEDGSPPAVAPVPYQTDQSLGSYHPGGCNVALCDSSAGYLSQDTDIDVLRALASRASEELFELRFCKLLATRHRHGICRPVIVL
jgi:hypothetical protein